MASPKRRIATTLCAAAVLALIVLTVRSRINRGDCRESPPFAKRRYPGQSVFLARVFYVSGNWQPSDEHIPWSLAVVEHRYWGVPWWTPDLGLIGHSGPFLKKGTEYFIDGDRTMARLSEFFPYIDFRCSGRTAPVSDAGVDLRVLRDGPPKSGVRIIGRTIRRFGVGDWRPAPGVKVSIAGPTGTTFTITDGRGIYDLIGLPPGHYSVRANPEDDADTFPRENYERVEGELRSGDIWGRDVLVK